MCPDAIDQHQHQGAIIHVQPIASSNKLVRSIPRERAVGVGTKIGFVKAGHGGREEVGVPDLEPTVRSSVMEALPRAQNHDHRVFDRQYLGVQHRRPGFAAFAGG
jgi:hypothetical protein